MSAFAYSAGRSRCVQHPTKVTRLPRPAAVTSAVIDRARAVPDDAQGCIVEPHERARARRSPSSDQYGRQQGSREGVLRPRPAATERARSTPCGYEVDPFGRPGAVRDIVIARHHADGATRPGRQLGRLHFPRIPGMDAKPNGTSSSRAACSATSAARARARGRRPHAAVSQTRDDRASLIGGCWPAETRRAASGAATGLPRWHRRACGKDSREHAARGPGRQLVQRERSDAAENRSPRPQPCGRLNIHFGPRYL